MKKIAVSLLVIASTLFTNVSAQSHTKKESKDPTIEQQLQGIYGFDDNPKSIRYIILGKTISEYHWDNKTNTWKLEFTAPFYVEYYFDDYYMTGNNIKFADQYGEKHRICCGDINGDGRMDLWWSDGPYMSKIK